MDQTLRTPAIPGDMDPEEFRHHGRSAVDWIAAYLREIESYPVLAQVQPGQIADQVPPDAPERGVAMETILSDFHKNLLPGITHWNHPGFMAYFGITASGPGIVGEALIAALNVNAMLWRTSPAATELEERTLDWLRQMIGLPPSFRGHIQDTASLSTLVAIAGARESAGLDVREQGLAGLPRLRLYCS